jgi:uncharacterized membrane protein YgcG
VTIYISAYVEAANRDAFMAVKQDLLLAFIDCCNRNGAKLARKRTQVSHTWFCSLLLVQPDCRPRVAHSRSAPHATSRLHGITTNVIASSLPTLVHSACAQVQLISPQLSPAALGSGGKSPAATTTMDGGSGSGGGGGSGGGASTVTSELIGLLPVGARPIYAERGSCKVTAVSSAGLLSLSCRTLACCHCHAERT